MSERQPHQFIQTGAAAFVFSCGVFILSGVFRVFSHLISCRHTVRWLMPSIFARTQSWSSLVTMERQKGHSPL